MVRWISLLMLLGCGVDTQDTRQKPAGETSSATEDSATGAESTPTTEPSTVRVPVRLTPAQHLRRASFTIRGEAPTLEELDQVAADPGALTTLVDAWLDSEQFGRTVRDLHAEVLLLRADTEIQLPAIGLMEGVPVSRIHSSTTDAALRLIERVVADDLPYTEILTADTMLTDEVLARVYGLPFDPKGPEWQEARWVDGRPMAGILSDSELWRRHVSNGSNFHRGRANFIADKLLCADFAGRDIVVEGGIDLSDEAAVAEAVNTLPGCIGCHQALDPLAAFLWGFKGQVSGIGVKDAHRQGCHPNPDNPFDIYEDRLAEDYCYPLRLYTPSLEDDWALWELRAPAYYTQPGTDLLDLGVMIGEDPRFAQCTARTAFAWATQRTREEVEPETLLWLTEAFESSQYSYKQLFRSIVLSDEFQTLVPATEEPATGLLVLRPEQMANEVARLANFRWAARPDGPGCGEFCWGEVDLLRSDLFGFRTMAGGQDSLTVTQPTHSAAPVKLLVTERLAQEVGGYVVLTEAGLAPDQRLLFSAIDLDSRDAVAARTQIALLQRQWLGEVDDPDRLTDQLLDLWQTWIDEGSEPADAWALVLAALLLDPLFLYY